MRIRRLGLERYGHFTDRTLEFGPEPVTVVLGANEAGKSTALAAVRDGLYGMGLTNDYAFLHPYPAMRVAMEIEGSDGRRLAFARLKRNKHALVDPSTDAPLPDDALSPFLGAHDRAAFLDVYGLDQRRLRAGGEALAQGGGDVAEALTAAAPGLSRIAALRDALQASAAGLFNPARRSAGQAFYKGLDRLGEATGRRRASELRVEEVKRLRGEAEAAQQTRREAETRETDTRLAGAEASLLARAARELRALDGLAARREALGALPEVPAGFVAAARARLAALDAATREAATARRECDQASAARAAIGEDEAVLPLAEAIEAAHDARASVRSGLGDRPRREEEATQARTGLARIAGGLGLSDAEAVRAGLPGTPLLARGDALADRLADLDTRRKALEEEAAALKTRLAARLAGDSASETETPPADPQRLAPLFEALEGAEAREARLAELETRLAAERASLDEQAARLGLGLTGADALATLPLPSLAGIEAALRRLAEAEAARLTAAKDLATRAEELTRAQAIHATLTAGRPAPTEAALAALRAGRDALWQRLRPLATGTRPPAPEDRDTADALERATDEADRMADERLSESTRLADLARAEREIAERGVAHRAAERRAAEAQADLAALQAAWPDVWAGVPAPPADGRALDVLRAVEAIRTARERLRQATLERERLAADARRARLDHEALRAALGLAPAAAGAPLAMAPLRRAREALEAAHQARRDAARDRAALERDLAELETRRDGLMAEAAALAREAAEIFPALAIRPEARAGEARAALRLWREAQTEHDRLATAERRIAGIDRDAAGFRAEMTALAQRLHLPAPEDAAVFAIALRTRLDEARRLDARAQEAQAALTLRRDALAQAEAQRSAAEAALAAEVAPVLERAPGPLEALLVQLEEAETLARQAREIEARLADQAGGRSPAELRARIDGRDDEALARHLAEAEAAHARAREARDAAVEADTRARAAYEALGARPGAGVAAQEEEDAAAEIAETVAHFTRDHVAGRLLALAVERYRQEHQSPIVARASALFSTLTRGRWQGIGIDYDAPQPRLGPRGADHVLGLGALSEGTRDQLFLALRIAAIEDHARRATPLPFLADDLFITFDETRTEAAFAALAELGATTQVIVFTHHRHVADAATRALGDAAGQIEL